MRFTGPDGAVNDQAQVIQVSNNVYLLSTFGAFGTRERLDEGVLGIATLELRGASDVAKLAGLEARGRVGDFERLLAWSTPEFTVEADSGMRGGHRRGSRRAPLAGDVPLGAGRRASADPRPRRPGHRRPGCAAPSWQWTLTALGRVGATGRWPAVTSPL